MVGTVTVTDSGSATPLSTTGGLSLYFPIALALMAGGVLALGFLRRRVS